MNARTGGQESSDSLPGVPARDCVRFWRASEVIDSPDSQHGRREELTDQENVARAGIDNIGDVVTAFVVFHAAFDFGRHSNSGPLVVVVARKKEDRTRSLLNTDACRVGIRAVVSIQVEEDVRTQAPLVEHGIEGWGTCEVGDGGSS